MNDGRKKAAFSGILLLLADVQLPPLPQGRPTTELRERWLSTCEVAMARGVRRAGTFARMTGVTPRTAKRWMSEVEARWRAEAETDASNIRREQLYREATEVAERAWAVVLAGKHPAWVVGAMRVVLESIRRRARLCGIDGPPPALRPDAVLDHMLESSPDSNSIEIDLAEAGRQLAIALSSQQRERPPGLTPTK